MISRQPNDGPLLVVEGIDGSGKSTILTACKNLAAERNLKVFDVVEFSEREHRLPDLNDIGDASVLMAAEPCFCWTGDAIRQEIIAKRESCNANRMTSDSQTLHDTRYTIHEPRYSGQETADAFALDRLVLFRRVIIPFLQNRPDRIVFKDRGVGSSLAYQPLQDTSLTTEGLLTLPGNAQSIAFWPTLLVLVRTEAAAAMARLEGRTDKQDNVIFEERGFQEKLAIRFLSEDVLGPFRRAGTDIAELDGNLPKEAMAAAAKTLLSQKLADFANIKQ